MIFYISIRVVFIQNDSVDSVGWFHRAIHISEDILLFCDEFVVILRCGEFLLDIAQEHELWINSFIGKDLPNGSLNFFLLPL